MTKNRRIEKKTGKSVPHLHSITTTNCRSFELLNLKCKKCNLDALEKEKDNNEKNSIPTVKKRQQRKAEKMKLHKYVRRVSKILFQKWMIKKKSINRATDKYKIIHVCAGFVCVKEKIKNIKREFCVCECKHKIRKKRPQQKLHHPANQLSCSPRARMEREKESEKCTHASKKEGKSKHTTEKEFKQNDTILI